MFCSQKAASVDAAFLCPQNSRSDELILLPTMACTGLLTKEATKDERRMNEG
jgi:hypothetical protein